MGRLVRSADFERVLRAPVRARSSHFAVHHVTGGPSLPPKPLRAQVVPELSTGSAPRRGVLVDDSSETDGLARLWVGAVVPKRHARRAVTRSLLKRQIRAAIGRQIRLPAGLWVVRLRSAFDREQFCSAASERLREAARQELDAMFAAVVRRESGD